MENTDRRRYNVLTRVRDFGERYGQLFPATTIAAEAFATVTEAVAEIDANDVAETTASVSARAARKQEARQALLERLTLVANTAQVLPDADTQLKAHFNVNPLASDQVLLTTARQCVQRATPLAAQFGAHGMPATFLVELTTLIDRFEAAIRDRGMSRGQLVAARAAIQAALRAGRTTVRQLDVIVANHLAENPVALEVWRRSIRIGRAPAPRRRATGTEPDATDASPQAPASPPVTA